MEKDSENQYYLMEEEKEQLKEVLPSLPEKVGILHIVREKRNMSSNEMETVENTLSLVIEDTIQEYSADSPVGRKLWEMREWNEGLD